MIPMVARGKVWGESKIHGNIDCQGMVWSVHMVWSGVKTCVLYRVTLCVMWGDRSMVRANMGDIGRIGNTGRMSIGIVKAKPLILGRSR